MECEISRSSRVKLRRRSPQICMLSMKVQNTPIYAQIMNPLREQVFRELEQHPKIVWLG
jgi:hypothetical protein